MTEVFFYHLTRRTLEEALPDLLERTLARQWRAVVLAGSDERVQALNSFLWTYSRDGFLPHGARGEGNDARQPVWLTPFLDNPNGAQVLFLVDGAAAGPEAVAPFDRVCDLFDGNDPDAVAAARERWKTLKAGGLTPVYWRQTGSGGWEKAS